MLNTANASPPSGRLTASARDCLHFPRQPRIVHPCAASRHFGDRTARNGCDDRAGGSGIADAHVAGRHHIQAGRQFGLKQFDSGPYRRLHLLLGHGRPVRHVARAEGDLAMKHSCLIAQIRCNSKIRHHHARSGLPRQDIDGCAAQQKVQHHLRRDGCRIGGDPLRRHTVVRRQHQNRLAGKARTRVARHACQLYDQIFQASQAALRLGQPIEPVGRHPHGTRIERPDLPHHTGDGVHRFHTSCAHCSADVASRFNSIACPAVTRKTASASRATC